MTYNPYTPKLFDSDRIFMRLSTAGWRGWNIYLRVTRCANGTVGYGPKVNNLTDLTLRSERIGGTVEDAGAKLLAHLRKAIPEGIDVVMEPRDPSQNHPQVEARDGNLYVRHYVRLRVRLPWQHEIEDDPALDAICSLLASAFGNPKLTIEANASDGGGTHWYHREPQQQRATG